MKTPEVKKYEGELIRQHVLEQKAWWGSRTYQFLKGMSLGCTEAGMRSASATHTSFLGALIPSMPLSHLINNVFSYYVIISYG